jgi:HD domain-containing protein
VRGLSTRRRYSLGLGLAANAALVPAFGFLAPSSSWTPPILMIAIAALALVGCFNSVQVANRPRSAFLDSEFVAALLAVVLLGPLPGFCVWAAGEVAYLILIPMRREAHLANVASYGWAALVGSLVLDALVPSGVSAAVDPRAWVAVAVTGAVVLCVNFAVTNAIVAYVLDGRSAASLIHTELITAAPAVGLMIATGTVTVFLYLAIGIPALALFSATVFIPRMAAKLGLDERALNGLEHAEVLPRYAEGIASAMQLEPAERLVIRDAASFIRMRDETPDMCDCTEAPLGELAHLSDGGRLSDLSDSHRHALVEALFYKGEHWDGRGGMPGAVGGEMIPLTSRILAVADAWAHMTAGGYPRLTNSEALDLLEARAGLHFDPAVVAVAASLVDRTA